MSRVRILVVDDHPVVQSGVAVLVHEAPAIEIVGYAPTGREAIERCEELRPDVVLLDLRLPDMLAPEVARRIRVLRPSTRILLFTAFTDHASLSVLDDSLVDGCLLKDVTPDQFVAAINAVSRGERVVDARIRSASPRAGTPGAPVLTRREYEVLRRVAMGETNPEIGDAIGLSRNTVKAYLQTVLQKLGARNRVDAIRRAHELGLL